MTIEEAKQELRRGFGKSAFALAFMQNGIKAFRETFNIPDTVTDDELLSSDLTKYMEKSKK